MEFKKITIEDEDIIKKIVEAEEEVFGMNGGADFWLVKAFVRYGLLFVILENNEVISMAEFIQVIDKRELFLYGFSTREKFRNKGYAKKLIEYSENKAKEMCFDSISLTVDPLNKIGVSLYLKKGYEIIEYQKNEYGEGINRYLMRKKL